ncbi:MAG TPA: ABC transporter permease [Burkholderiaceae bacterium]|jgi:phospholipid/cholesterol/gamma-HCH transport system permease protein|nr:ABC transporter permease [Burkholderiaceae bacterium]
MVPTTSRQGALAELGSLAARWLVGWWRVLHLGVMILALASSSSSYRRANRSALFRHIYLSTASNLAWFTVLSALLSLVLIRIVLVTALSYGLSEYALQMVVRVLVLELIPLVTALFVALRCTIPYGAEIAAMRSRGEFDSLKIQGLDPLQHEVLPRVLAGAFAVLTLASMSCVVTLVLAYLSAYGFTRWGFEGYTHTVGQIFTPAVALIFLLKILLMSLAVSLIPVASVLYDAGRSRTSVEMRGLVRMFLVILLIEAASLVGNYY